VALKLRAKGSTYEELPLAPSWIETREPIRGTTLKIAQPSKEPPGPTVVRKSG
jgi:hypothetical protein